MTNEQKDTIATYITAFKNFLARHILPDVAIRATVYPTSDQVLLVITLNRNNQGGTEFRHECASTEEAFQKAGVDPDLLPESDEYSHRIGVSADRCRSKAKSSSQGRHRDRHAQLPDSRPRCSRVRCYGLHSVH